MSRPGHPGHFFLRKCSMKRLTSGPKILNVRTVVPKFSMLEQRFCFCNSLTSDFYLLVKMESQYHCGNLYWQAMCWQRTVITVITCIDRTWHLCRLIVVCRMNYCGLQLSSESQSAFLDSCLFHDLLKHSDWHPSFLHSWDGKMLAYSFSEVYMQNIHSCSYLLRFFRNLHVTP